MKRDIMTIVAFIAVLVVIVLFVAPTPTSPCMKRVGACSVYTGV
jgi:hypothetical protein